jgi:hypothetical protein
MQIKNNNTKKDLDNIKFLDNYDLEILRKTYIKVLQYFFEKYEENITTCPKPSFISYLLTTTPYYTKSELINLGLNKKLIREENEYNINDIKLCQIVSENDIEKNTLIAHQLYIQKHRYLIKNFSFLSSSKYNKYLRLGNKKDFELEKNIKSIQNLIINAPPFDKSYYIYRFISDDIFLQNLKIGDIFIDKGFLSTTRNPFYDGYNNVFGYILIKIKIPKGIKGVGICVETYSVFPNEQEIILSLGSKLKLINKDDNFKYYHTDIIFQELIKKKYEFEWIGVENLKIEYPLPQQKIPIIKWNWDINFLEEENILDRIITFTKKYTFQNKTILNYKNKNYLLYCEKYNSIGAYKDFFNIINENGYYIYIQNEIESGITGSYDLFFEINNEGSVNFISKYIDNDKDNNLDDDLLLELIGIISVIFKIQKVLIHPYYKSFKKINNKKDIYGENIYICEDLLKYLTNGNKRFAKHINKGIENRLYYFQLDKLKEKKVEDFVSLNDNNNLYYICKNNKQIKNLLDLYLYLVAEHYEEIKDMEKQLDDKIYKGNNPFDNRYKYYIYYPYEYLYNYKYINVIPVIKEKYNIKYNFGDNFDIKLIRTQRNQI